jgi:hypothetical protein
MRRNRVDALASVLQCFDAEEESDESSRIPPIASSVGVQEQLRDLIEGQADCAAAVDESLRWENLVSVCNSLLLFRDMLKLNISVDLDHIASLLKDSVHIPDDVKVEMRAVAMAAVMPVKEEVKAAMDVVKDIPSADMNAAAEEDEEWDESVAVAGPTVEPSSSSSLESSTPKHDLARAYVERIILSLVNVLSDDLTALLELTEDKKSHGAHLPLNHLTWPEHVRMLIVTRLTEDFNAQWRPKPEDMTFILKGNKGIGFRSNKNMVRNFRYRMVADLQKPEDDKPAIALAPTVDYASLPCPANLNDYFTEVEIESALEGMALDAGYSMSYRRCARVLLKLVKMSITKHLIWEIDSNTYPYFYSIISRPMMLCNVATNLVIRAYGEEDMEVCMCFYRDVSLSALNSFAFYSETNVISGHAVRVAQTLRRHMRAWVWDAAAPAVERCTDQFCFLSGRPLPPSPPVSHIKCFKCSASFHLDHLESLQHHAHVHPSYELVSNFNEEWCCLFCIQESSSSDRSLHVDTIPYTSSVFDFNEWGFTASVPWFMSVDISSRATEVLADEESRCRFEALKLLCDPQKMSSPRVGDKLIIIRALCDLLKYNAKCAEYVSKLQSECNKLLRTVAKDSFRDAELLDIVKVIVKDNAVAVYHNLFEGSDDAAEADVSGVIEGRCIVCKGTTYEEELPEDAQVVLCDGCNGEAHLECLNLAEVGGSRTPVMADLFRC